MTSLCLGLQALQALRSPEESPQRHCTRNLVLLMDLPRCLGCSVCLVVVCKRAGGQGHGEGWNPLGLSVPCCCWAWVCLLLALKPCCKERLRCSAGGIMQQFHAAMQWVIVGTVWAILA